MHLRTPLGSHTAIRILLISLLWLAGESLAPAQVTSARIKVTVLDAVTGKQLPDSLVEMTFTKANFSKTAATNEEGIVAFTGLRIGGSYKVTASKSGYTEAFIENIDLRIGSNDTLTVSLSPVESITVTGSRLPGARLSQFDEEDVRNLPSVSQDPKDIARLTPDAYTDGEKLSIGGANPRFNSLTVDGIGQNDDFGLNTNGYPTNRSPISLYAIEDLSVEKAPFDVRYGNFLGGNINVVTKSGDNEYTGNVRTTQRSGGLTGKKSKDETIDTEFSESRYGFSLGGPIMEDQLYFFADVEGLTNTKPSPSGAAGSGRPFTIDSVSAEDVARVQQISQDVYNFDSGSADRSLDEFDLRSLLKLDYIINDDHRLEAKYQRSQGSEISGANANVSGQTLYLSSNWYKRSQILDTYSLRLISDWNYQLSTKLEYSLKNVEVKQESVNGLDLAQMSVITPDGGTIVFGPDRFRHANALENDKQYLKSEVNYLLDEHLITAGLENEAVDIFNLFVESSRGRAQFDSIDALENRSPTRIDYANAYTNNSQDGAANWSYDITTLYAQDEWQITSDIAAKFGLRAEFYGAKGDIEFNENFYERHGFANTSDIDGKQVLLPRLGLSYQRSSNLIFRTGLGLFSGGTPNVWMSNNYTNDGVTIVSASITDSDGAIDFDGRTIPESLTSQLEAGNGNVNALDPDFEIPRSLKFAMGADYSFDIGDFIENLNLSFNYTYSQVQKDVLWQDLRRNHSGFSNNQPSAIGPDGRALYDLTPSDSEDEGSFDAFRGYDLMLTNTDKGYSHNASIQLAKSFPWGLRVTGSYNWQRVKDVSSASGFLASENYSQQAVGLDPENPDLATSNYEREHRFVLSTSYNDTLIGNLLSTVTLFTELRSGQPYSFTFGESPYSNDLARLFGESSSFGFRERMLFYVPKGDGSDVEFAEGFDEAAFNSYLSKYGLDKYRGKIAPRNAFRGNWVRHIDLRLAQGLPGIKDGHEARVILDIANLPNLINNKWGQVKQAVFPYMIPIVDVSYNEATGKYVYSNFQGGDPEQDTRLSSLESVWTAQLSVVYNF